MVPVEELSVERGHAALAPQARVEPWRNVHRRASDTRQGALLICAGRRLRPPEIAVAAAAGMARIRVSSQPMLVVISTGNELVEPGEPVLAHQVRRSNAYAMVSALREHGFQRVADDHIMDDARELRERLRFHLETHDVLVLSGGVSMGRFDLVPAVLEELGVRTIFHKVAQRPGKPLWFGMAPSGAAVFGLPGNPVSTLVCFARYVLPALCGALGESSAARVAPGARRARHRDAAADAFHARAPRAGRLGARPGRCRCRPTARATSPRSPAPMVSSSCRPGRIPIPRAS